MQAINLIKPIFDSQIKTFYTNQMIITSFFIDFSDIDDTFQAINID